MNKKVLVLLALTLVSTGLFARHKYYLSANWEYQTDAQKPFAPYRLNTNLLRQGIKLSRHDSITLRTTFTRDEIARLAEGGDIGCYFGSFSGDTMILLNNETVFTSRYFDKTVAFTIKESNLQETNTLFLVISDKTPSSSTLFDGHPYFCTPLYLSFITLLPLFMQLFLGFVLLSFGAGLSLRSCLFVKDLRSIPDAAKRAKIDPIGSIDRADFIEGNIVSFMFLLMYCSKLIKKRRHEAPLNLYIK